MLGHFLRIAPPFKGRGRLTHYWVHRRRSDHRTRVLPGGAEIRCDMSVPYESMVWLGKEEEEDLAVLRRLLRGGDTFVDCGANIGLWTLTASTATGARGTVYAFEPNPATFEKLQRNVEANALQEVVMAMCAACGASEGKMPFLCSVEHNNSRMAAPAEEKAVMVPVTTLDVALRGGVVHGIKIDVEGNELAVLHGAREILERSKPWLCVEFNSLLAGARSLRDWDVHRHLRGLGYSCCRMADAAGSPANHVLDDDWGLQGYCNLFYFVP